jgi:hypothetical protein
MKTNKTFADLAKQIQNKYAKKTDSISKRSMERELNNLMQLNEEARQEKEMLSQNSQEQFRYGGRLPRYEGGGTDPWFNDNKNAPYLDVFKPINTSGIYTNGLDPKSLFTVPNAYSTATPNTMYGPNDVRLSPMMKRSAAGRLSLDPKNNTASPLTNLMKRTPAGQMTLDPMEYRNKKPGLAAFKNSLNNDLTLNPTTQVAQASKDSEDSEDPTGKDNFMTPGNYLGLGAAGIATIGDFALAAKNKPRYVKNYFRGVMNPAIAETRRSLGDADRAMTAEGRLSLNKVLNDVSNNSGSNASRIANMSSILSNYNNQSGINRAKLRSEFTGKIGQLLASQGQLEGQGEFMRQEINTQEEDAQRQSYADALRNMETRGYNSAQLLNKNTENTQKFNLVKEYFPDFTVEKDGNNLELYYKKAAELKRKEAELAKKQKNKK